LASRILDLYFVLDIRDSWEMESVTHQGVLRNQLKEALERMCARNADKVWLVTSTLRERLRAKYRLQPERLELVPNGADIDVFRPSENPRTVDLVFLGSPARYRNIRAVMQGIAAIRRVRPNVRAKFIGWVGAPNEEAIRLLVSNLGIGSNVELAPPAPRSLVCGEIGRAKLGIVSLSSEEVFRGAIGAKAYEYVACGVPLACLGPPGDSELRRFVETRSLGFYASDPEEFASSAADLLQGNDHWRELSGNCRAASRMFDRRAISEWALRTMIRPFLSTRDGG
jgi:glycosyltransferase involved in cell wall biosynthesis